MTYKRKEVIEGAKHPIVAIYSLCNSDGSPRYIGKTTQYLHQRHKAHIRLAKAGGRLPVSRWLKKELNAGRGLTIKLIEYAGEEWASREAYWIAKHRSDGAALLNLTDGGEGLHGHKFTVEHKLKISSKLKRGAIIPCSQCGAKFWRKPSAATSSRSFCSRPCYFEWQKGKPKRNDQLLMGVAGRAAALDAKRKRRNGN